MNTLEEEARRRGARGRRPERVVADLGPEALETGLPRRYLARRLLEEARRGTLYLGLPEAAWP